MKGSSISSFLALVLLSALLLQPLSAQEFSSIDEDLQLLESLITGTLLNTEEQQRQLQDLKRNLGESGSLIGSYENIIQEHENSLRALQTRLNEMSEAYRTQSSLSAKYEGSSKFWKTFTLIAVPAAGVAGAALGWRLAANR